jgi:hypothetical protein
MLWKTTKEENKRQILEEDNWGGYRAQSILVPAEITSVFMKDLRE